MVNKPKILQILEETYSHARCALHFRNPFELLIATMLSAQTTDRQVNEITKTLFAKYKTPADFARLNPEELEAEIKSVGLYRHKAKNIIATCRKLVADYGGEVPASLEELTKLPGVGRKTANVVLANAFGIPALAVDTHVFRVANRLGLARARDPEETEEQLKVAIPKDQWAAAHHWLIWHGRNICDARRPKCGECPLAGECALHRRT